jgi:hypothetical protein
MIEEIWKDIKSYEGLYKISNYGRIKRLIGYRCRKERILKATKRNKNIPHLRIDLCKNTIKRTYFIHHLVLQTFIGICPAGMEACHNDGNAKNNFIENLRYDTHKNNMLDSIKHGTRARGIKNNKAKFNNNQILEIRLSNLKIIELAKKFNVDRHTISRIKHKQTWNHIYV